MQLCQAATFIASTAFFLPNVNASLLRGVDGEFAIGDGDILEVTVSHRRQARKRKCKV